MIITLILLLFLAFVLVLAVTVIVHVVSGVPFVPSSRRATERIIALARLQDKDIVYDLGCGDGRLLFHAARTKNIRGIGFEIAPFPYLLAKIKQAFLRTSVDIRFENFFNANIGDAKVIFCYLTPAALARLAAKIKKECKKGTRIVSNTFKIPGLPLKKTVRRSRAAGRAYLYEI